jgi:hypothetical protein
MPNIIAMFMGAIGLSLRSFVGRILIALGIAYVTYQGVDVLLDSIKTQTFAMLQGVPPDVLGVIGLARLGEGCNVIFSAITARFALNGLTNGSFTRSVIK